MAIAPAALRPSEAAAHGRDRESPSQRFAITSRKMERSLLRIYIDADACPVKDETYRVATRYGIGVLVVANSPILLTLPVNV